MTHTSSKGYTALRVEICLANLAVREGLDDTDSRQIVLATISRSGSKSQKSNNRGDRQNTLDMLTIIATSSSLMARHRNRAGQLELHVALTGGMTNRIVERFR